MPSAALWRQRGIGVALLIIGVCLAAAQVAHMQDLQQLAASGKVSAGVVIGHQSVPSALPGGRVAPVVQWRDGARAHEAVAGTLPHLPIGATVAVRFDPQEPVRHQVSTAGAPGGIRAADHAVLFVAACLLVAGAGLSVTRAEN